MLSLDVEFIQEVYFGASGPESTQPDWPPQPDRVFSAFVASWAARGKRAQDTEALQWLERQSNPIIFASECAVRDARTVYVPPNDVSGLEVLPDCRRRQERRFPAALPKIPQVTYHWPYASPAEPIFDSLYELALDTSAVGRAASLARCFFLRGAQPPEAVGRDPTHARRWVYPGRLEELERTYKQGRRPAPGASVPPQRLPPRREPQSNFGGQDKWHIFASVGGVSLDPLAGAIAASAFRAALLSGFRGRPAPEFLSGHNDKGWPSVEPHLAIFPLLNVGWKWSDGRLKGLALCLPRRASRDDERILFGALKRLMSAQRQKNPDGIADVELGLPGKITLYLSRQPHPSAASLQPRRYVQSATTWSTVTPVVLDHELMADDPYRSFSQWDRIREIRECIARACTNIGLPEPIEVRPAQHASIKGSPSIPPRNVKPIWAHWGIPASVKRKQLTHATLIFAEPIQGPVVLGAGRYYGLGLCLPVGGNT